MSTRSTVALAIISGIILIGAGWSLNSLFVSYSRNSVARSYAANTQMFSSSRDPIAVLRSWGLPDQFVQSLNQGQASQLAWSISAEKMAGAGYALLRDIFSVVGWLISGVLACGAFFVDVVLRRRKDEQEIANLKREYEKLGFEIEQLKLDLKTHNEKSAMRPGDGPQP